MKRYLILALAAYTSLAADFAVGLSKVGALDIASGGVLAAGEACVVAAVVFVLMEIE